MAWLLGIMQIEPLRFCVLFMNWYKKVQAPPDGSACTFYYADNRTWTCMKLPSLVPETSASAIPPYPLLSLIFTRQGVCRGGVRIAYKARLYPQAIKLYRISGRIATIAEKKYKLGFTRDWPEINFERISWLLRNTFKQPFIYWVQT